MNLNHVSNAATPRRKSRKPNAFAFPIFLDEQGRECHRLPTKNGRDILILKEDFDLIRPYLVSGKFLWNDDNKRGEDGELLRYYPKATARIPGKKAKRKPKVGCPTISRLIWLARAKAYGIPSPLNGWEVAYVDPTKRHDVRPDNLKIRPRWENKHFVRYVMACDAMFDPMTGFDRPEDAGDV
jgi:hypothetical protein